jgi:hypothetical protein
MITGTASDSPHHRRHFLGSIKPRGKRAAFNIRELDRIQFACRIHPECVRVPALIYE